MARPIQVPGGQPGMVGSVPHGWQMPGQSSLSLQPAAPRFASKAMHGMIPPASLQPAISQPPLHSMASVPVGPAFQNQYRNANLQQNQMTQNHQYSAGTQQPPPMAQQPLSSPQTFFPLDPIELTSESSVLEQRVAQIQQNMTIMMDMIQDQAQSLQLDAQERAEFARLVQSEQKDRSEQLDAERESRESDVAELKKALKYVLSIKDSSGGGEGGEDSSGALQELQEEARQRASDLEQLVDSLSQECGVSANQIKSLTMSLQSECDTRANEVKRLALALNSNRDDVVNECRMLVSDSAGSDSNAGSQTISARLRADIEESKNRGQNLESLVGQMQSEMVGITKRLEELTKAVLNEREAVRGWLNAGGAR